MCKDCGPLCCNCHLNLDPPDVGYPGGGLYMDTLPSVYAIENEIKKRVEGWEQQLQDIENNVVATLEQRQMVVQSDPNFANKMRQYDQLLAIFDAKYRDAQTRLVLAYQTLAMIKNFTHDGAQTPVY